MPVKVHMLTLGMLQTNCFVVADTDSKEAVVIDPADEAPKILQVLQNEGYTVREILLTHAHFDHVLASKPLKEATNAPLRLHADATDHLKNTRQVAAMFGMNAPEPATHDGTLDEGDVIEFGDVKLETLYTPGHAPGHVTFVLRSEKVVISGDCLFMSGIGRTDLPGGDYRMLMTSIFEKLIPLGDDFTVCPGHGPTTTIEHERRTNPFLLEWSS